MLMDMNSRIQYPYLGYLLRGRVDKAEQVQPFGCHTFQIGGWIFFILCFFLVGQEMLLNTIYAYLL